MVVSGDYKRRRDPTCAAFEPVPCDVFITEATFGLPVFRHPDDAGEIRSLLSSVAQFPDRCHLVGAYALGKAQRQDDARGRYIEFCKSSFPFHLSLQGLRIVLDCAHGAAYQVGPAVFTELGATVIKLSCEPDGLNINRDCGSTHPEALQRAVVEQGADLGIAFDGDADRSPTAHREAETAKAHRG